MKKHASLLILLFLFFSETYAQTNIKTMFYNLLYYPSGDPQDREDTLKDILDIYQPDIFTVCELETEAGADEILTQSIQSSRPNFARAAFVSNQSDPNPDNQLNQMVYYNTDMFTLESQQTHLTYIRDIMQYTLLLKTEDQATNPIKIEYFVVHFKSSDGTTNKAIRLDMANVFTAVLEDLDPNAYVVFSGDFNLYTSSEPAYQEILDPTNAIVMIDPINDNSSLQSWSNDTPTYTAMHTQATRVNQQNGNGAFSGLDDRFDFSFVSENLIGGSELFYVDGSYDAYGNNKNCYNLDINDASCTGTYSQSLRDDLYIMSDHLPVVMELQTPQNLLAVDEFSSENNLRILGSNLIDNNVSLYISPSLFNSDLYIYNQLGQIVKTVETSTSNQILVDVSNFPTSVYVIKSATKKFINPIKFVKIN
jgi:endonuclease/exonuclease/phosphatase family metal-dependent hydrolase